MHLPRFRMRLPKNLRSAVGGLAETAFALRFRLRRRLLFDKAQVGASALTVPHALPATVVDTLQIAARAHRPFRVFSTTPANSHQSASPSVDCIACFPKSKNCV